MGDDAKDDAFLKTLEDAVTKIVKGKSTATEKLAAINAGVRLAAIKHKVSGGGEEEKGFFGK